MGPFVGVCYNEFMTKRLRKSNSTFRLVNGISNAKDILNVGINIGSEEECLIEK